MTMNEVIFDETNMMIFEEFIQHYPHFINNLKEFDTAELPVLMEGVTLFQTARNEFEESQVAEQVKSELFYMLDALNTDEGMEFSDVA